MIGCKWRHTRLYTLYLYLSPLFFCHEDPSNLLLLLHAPAAAQHSNVLSSYFLIFFQSAEPYSDYEHCCCFSSHHFLFLYYSNTHLKKPLKRFFFLFFVINQSMPYSLFPPKKTFDLLYFLSTGNWCEKKCVAVARVEPSPSIAPPDKKGGGGDVASSGVHYHFSLLWWCLFLIVLLFLPLPSLRVYSSRERDESPFRLFFSFSLSCLL